MQLPLRLFRLSTQYTAAQIIRIAFQISQFISGLWPLFL